GLVGLRLQLLEPLLHEPELVAEDVGLERLVTVDGGGLSLRPRRLFPLEVVSQGRPPQPAGLKSASMTSSSSPWPSWPCAASPAGSCAGGCPTACVNACSFSARSRLFCS